MVEKSKLASQASATGGILILLLGLWFVSAIAVGLFFNQGDCPGLGGPTPVAGCEYAPFFFLYASQTEGYLILVQGIALELMGVLLLVVRSAYLETEKRQISKAGKSFFKGGILLLALGLLFVSAIAIVLSPNPGCLMGLTTVPAPACAYVPYTILNAWEGNWVLGIGIFLELLGVLMLVWRRLWYYEEIRKEKKLPETISTC